MRRTLLGSVLALTLAPALLAGLVEGAQVVGDEVRIQIDLEAIAPNPSSP